MVTEKFLLRDKMYRGIIVCKIVGHGHNGRFNGLKIRPLFCHYKTLPCVLLPGGKLRATPASHRCQRFLHRNGILPCIPHPMDAADGVRMALAYAPAPEGIVPAARKDSAGIQAVQ